MILTIDPASPVPMYRQLADQVIYRLASGELADGDQLPSIRSVSTALRINPNTVIKAYRELEHLGFSASHHGKGYFVTGGSLGSARASWRDRALEVLREAADRAVSVGVTPETIRKVVESVISGGGNHE